jgi:hypothetical protein
MNRETLLRGVSDRLAAKGASIVEARKAAEGLLAHLEDAGLSEISTAAHAAARHVMSAVDLAGHTEIEREVRICASAICLELFNGAMNKEIAREVNARKLRPLTASD